MHLSNISARFLPSVLDLVVTVGAPAAACPALSGPPLCRYSLVENGSERATQESAKSMTAFETTVAQTLDFQAVFNNMLRVIPDTKRVAIVVGSSATEKFWVERLDRLLEPFKS